MRACLIGCGNIGLQHAEAMVRTFDKVWFYDDILDKAKTFAKDFRQKNRYGRWPKKYDFDVYAICVPVDKHYVANEVIKNSRDSHIVIEKPCGKNLREAQGFLDMNRGRNWIYSTYQRRFDFTLLALSDLKAEINFHVYDNFEWVCHYYDMLTWYQGKINLKLSEEKIRTKITDMDGKEIPRNMGVAWLSFYKNLCMESWYCSGRKILYPHLMNERKISH